MQFKKGKTPTAVRDIGQSPETRNTPTLAIAKEVHCTKERKLCWMRTRYNARIKVIEKRVPIAIRGIGVKVPYTILEA
jgi:hypothetical protein